MISRLQKKETDLGSVWHKQGRGEVANDTRAKVDDADAQRSGQLLQVAHDNHLEGDRNGQVKDAGVQEQRRPQSVKLVGEVGRVERQHSANVVHTRHLKQEHIPRNVNKITTKNDSF